MKNRNVIPFCKNKRINDMINKIIFTIHKDVSYSYGGWLFFMGRLMWNAIILYYVLAFVKAFFLFSFKAQEVIPPERLEVVGTIIWGIGVVYLVMKIPTWKEEK